jgi:hypothetical protein
VLKGTIFWDITPCSLLEVHECLRVNQASSEQEVSSMLLQNGCEFMFDYMVVFRWRGHSSQSLLWQLKSDIVFLFYCSCLDIVTHMTTARYWLSKYVSEVTLSTIGRPKGRIMKSE